MMLMRRHDRYVGQAFWATFAAVLLFFTVIVIVLDASERMSKLTRFWGQIEARGLHPLAVMGEYYLTLVPFLWLKLMPFCVPAAAAFCLSRLMRHNELTPLITTGVSMRRTVAPIVLSGLVIVVGMISLQETVIPHLSRRHLELFRILARNTPDRVTRVPHFHDRRGGRLSMEAYLPIARRMEAVMITFWDADNGAPLELFEYPALDWNEKLRHWTAPDGGSRIPLDAAAPGEKRFPLAKGHIAPLDGSASLLEVALTASASPGLSYKQVSALAAANPTNLRFKVLMQEMLTLPLSTLILLLLTLPFSFRISSRTKSAIPGMLGAMGVSGLYFGGHFLAGSLARSGDWNPVVLAWMPTVIFGSLGIALFSSLDQ